MRIAASAASFTAFLAMIIAFVFYVGSLGIRVTPPADRANLMLDINEISNLVIGSNVLVRGIPVGKVTAIESSVSTATIHFYVDGKHQVPVDSQVRLENLSALGEAYLEIDPQSTSGPILKDGQHIEAKMVKQPTSISVLATSIVRVLNQLDPDQLHRVIDEADTALPDPNTFLPNLSRASLLLNNTVKDLNGQGSELLDNVQTLLRNAEWVGPTLAKAAPDIRDLGFVLKKLWNDALPICIRDSCPANAFLIGKLITRIQKLLDDRGPDIRILTEPLLANVKAIAASINTIDSGEFLGHMLDAVPESGSIVLHVAVPEAPPAPQGPPTSDTPVTPADPASAATPQNGAPR